MKKYVSFFAVSTLIALAALQPAVAARPGQFETYKPVQTSPEDLALVAVGVVKDVPKSDQIVLTNGTTYALDNIRVPVHLEQDVRAYMNSTLKDKEVGLFVNKFLKDNHNDKLGNLLVHILTDKGGWVQADLVSKGYAWAYSTDTSRDLVIPLYGFENAARAQKLGLWRNPENAPRNEMTIKQSIGSFQLYEGLARGFKVGTGGSTGYGYINFGNDPATDFTILIKPTAMSLFDRKMLDNIAQERLRIRGWVEDSSGPAIYLTHPEQLEMLGKNTVTFKLVPCPLATRSTAANPCQERGGPDTITVPVDAIPPGLQAPKN